MDTTTNYKLQKPALGKSETATDLINAVSANSDICETQFTTLNSSVNSINSEINGIVDLIIDEGQATGGSLNGYIVTKQGFVFQWGRASIPAGAGARIALPKSTNITIGVNANCTSGMYLVYIPDGLIAGNAFNVATNSPNTEEIFWKSVGRM